MDLFGDRYDVIGLETIINAVDAAEAAPRITAGGDKDAVLQRLRDVRARLDRLIAAVEEC